MEYCGNSGAPGGFIVGIQGRADYYVDALGIICDDGFSRPYFGGGGGREFVDTCPPGEMVLAIRGRAGSWMDSIQIYCGRYGGY